MKTLVELAHEFGVIQGKIKNAESAVRVGDESKEMTIYRLTDLLER